MARESDVVRREKQRLRQRAYRARMKEQKKPSHEDLARALLDVTLTTYGRKGRHEELMQILDRVAKRLKEIGFHARDTEAAWFDLQDRYERGWSMLRQRRPIAEMEAEGLREAERNADRSAEDE